MATIYQVSDLAKVSLATVSRVINGNAKVSDKTRAKVLAAMKELGYRPNTIAQSLASNRSNCIGLLVSEINGPFFGQMMSGVETEIRAAGKQLLITTGHSDEEKEKEGIEFLISRNCDAIILHVESVSDEYLVKLSKGKTPIFLVSRKVNELSLNCISLDNELGGYLATKSLIDMGHQYIAYIAGPLYKPDSAARLAGHKRALQEHHIFFNEELLVEEEFKEAGGMRGLNHFLHAGAEFTALVCANDEMASGAMTFARENNIQMPNELSVVGFDNVVFAPHLYPKLTTIDNPVHQMGKMAAKLVLKNVYKQTDLEIQHLFKPSLIIRDSVSIL